MFETTVSDVTDPTAGPTIQLWQRPMAALGLVALAVLVTGLSVWSLTRPDGSVPASLRRFAINVGPARHIL